jgi:hypothetical protein
MGHPWQATPESEAYRRRAQDHFEGIIPEFMQVAQESAATIPGQIERYGMAT